MYLSKLQWDATKSVYAGTIGFGRISVTFAVDGDKGSLKIADTEFCKCFKGKTGSFVGNWSVIKVVLTAKTEGELSLMFFDKGYESKDKPEDYVDPPF